MKFGRRPVLALLTALVVFNILLRYPQTEHEIGVDSFFIHVLAGSIVGQGYARWVIHPLSYLGLYPLSYPSAGPFLLASSTTLTDINLEGTILIVSMFLGPLGILTAFLMAREFRLDGRFGLAVAMIYGLAPRFLSFTLWSASTRNLFMALLPFFVWALLRTYRKPRLTQIALLFLSLTMLAATHRLVILMVVIFLAFIGATVAVAVLRILRIQFPAVFMRNSVRRMTPHLALLAILVSALGTLAGTNVLERYSEGEIGTGADIQTQMVNLSVSVARSGGFALGLGIVGLVVMTRARGKTHRESFLAMALLCLIPTLFLRQYTGFYILPFLALFGGLGVVGILDVVRRRPRMTHVAAVGLVLAISSFSAYVLDVEISRSTEIGHTTYSTGMYVRYLEPSGSIIANEGLMGIRVAAVSGIAYLPVGGAGTTFQSPELLSFNFYSASEVEAQVVRANILDLTVESDSLWMAVGIQAELDWVRMLQSPNGELPDTLWTRYRPAYYLEANQAAGRFVAYGNIYCSSLALSLHSGSYRIFDSGLESVWSLDVSKSVNSPATLQTCP